MITDMDRLLFVYMLQTDIVNGGKFIRSKSFVQFKTFHADEITKYGCLMRSLMSGAKYVRSEDTTVYRCITFFNGRKDFFLHFFILFESVQWDRAFEY